MSIESIPDILPFDGEHLESSRKQFENICLTSWARDKEEIKQIDSNNVNVALFQNDISTCNSTITSDLLDLFTGPQKEWGSKALLNNATVPLVQLFGITSQGTSTLLNIWGMFAYLYFPCPKELANNLSLIKDALEDQLKLTPAGKGFTERVLSVDTVLKKSLLFYNKNNEDTLFCRAVVASPQLVAPLRSAIESGIRVRVNTPNSSETISIPATVFEANIPFELRFMTDIGMKGCSWIEIPAGTYIVRPQYHLEKTSHCQLEMDVFLNNIIVHPPEDSWQSVPPLRILSFDIECVTETGKGFPVPETDKVIQIATVVMIHGSNEPIFKTVFTLNSCTSIPGALVCWFTTESEMLSRWRDLVIHSDPDILTGYNCINFDMNYLLVRSGILKLKEFKQLSRLKESISRIRDTVLSSRGLGTHENKAINIEGRVQMDMLDIIRRDFKLKSYTLNAVSAHFLKEQKEDVHYSMLAELFRANAETRRRVASYCLKDAILPARLMNKLLIMVNYIEMARVTGTPLSFLLTRGQQIKVTSQILRKCKELGFLFPSVRSTGKSGDDKAYEGATVLDPLKGLYKLPVATLDFASLYPSIMMAHNLCYSTLCIDPPTLLGLEEKDITRTPSHTIFVKKTQRRGVLPLIVEDLITARKKAKKAMEAETDKMTQMVLNGRQLALKLSANSVYGYTGAITGGQLPCIEVSTAITAYGREMIDLTKSAVEQEYCTKNGYPCDATVVYGDTDSVMVLFGVADISEAMSLGRQAAAFVTQRFVSPIKLEFEKVFCPFLLMNKKRYAGLLYTTPEAYSKIDCKGIETVRRDFCLLVKQLVDTVLKKLLIDKDEEGAKSYTKDIISQLLQNKIDLSLLVVSRSLGKEEYTSKLAHVELAKKLRLRDSGTAPQIGDRVHFVIIPGVKGQPQYDRAEDPLYVLENNLTVDTQYYLDNIKNPIIRYHPLYGIMDNPESIFVGSHTHKRKVLTSSSGAMSRFVKVSLRCLGCRSIIHSGALCHHCEKEKQRQLILEKFSELRDREHIFSKLWTQCQRCQGSLAQEVLCTSRDCPIFYRRMKIKKDIDEIQNQVDRLSLDW